MQILLLVMVLFLFHVIHGYKVGIIKKVIQCLSMLIAIILSLFCFSYVAKTIRNLTGVEQLMQEKITKVVEEQIEKDLDGKGSQREAIEGLKLPDNIKDALIANNNEDVYEALGIEKFTEYISSYLANMIVNALAFVVTFVIVFTLMKLLLAIADIASHLPVIRGMNKILGALLGAGQGILTIWIFFAIITMAIGTEFGMKVYEQILSQPILNYLYEHNIILDMISNLSKLIY
ncbi:MAG: CvpA family protein [Lachnospiraceae bacterium]|nr:CvpA family protein [Lachnospiraceae bacterium]